MLTVVHSNPLSYIAANSESFTVADSLILILYAVTYETENFTTADYDIVSQTLADSDLVSFTKTEYYTKSNGYNTLL